MAETAAWFFVWIPKKEEEIRLIQEEKVKKKKADEELKKQEEEKRRLEEEQEKLVEENRLKEEELAKKVIDGLNEGQTDTEKDWPELSSVTGSVMKIDKFPSLDRDEKLSSIIEVKTMEPNKTEEDKLIDIIDDNLLIQDSGGPDNVGSIASVTVIEVKEAPIANVDASPKAELNPRRLSVLTSPVEQVLTERTTIDGSVPSSPPKGSEQVESIPDLGDESSQDIADIMTLEEVLNKELLNFSASGLCWQLSRDKKNLLSMFFVKSSDAENVLNSLRNVGIGHDFSSTISVLKTSLHYESVALEESVAVASIVEEARPITAEEIGKVEDKIDRFYNSIKSRMMVGEVISNIENNAHFTFDFMMLLILAGIIAFLGLVESSSVVLVASMLISPLMGPILAGVFGTVIGDSKLRNLGVINELFSLCICILTGFVLGLMVCPWIETYGVPQWPTTEMHSRGELRSLWVGVLVAVPSGAGVALSVLAGNAGSLVGVAISASLLPPAVNAGFFWGLSLLIGATGGSVRMFGAMDDNLNMTAYRPEYSDNQAVEAFFLGLVSLTLTILNIVCIIVTGIAILRLKEVTPDKIPQTFSEFWKTDVRSRRGKYSRLEDEEAFLEEGKEWGLDGTIIQGLFEEAQKDEDMTHIRKWVVATQGVKSAKRPYRYTVVGEKGSSTSYQSVREGPGYRLNKASMLRQQKLKEMRENPET